MQWDRRLKKDLTAAGKGKVTARVSLVEMTVHSFSSERWNYPTNQLNADTNRFGDVIMSNKRAEKNCFTPVDRHADFWFGFR